MNLQKIVVGVDGSPGSAAALEWTIQQAGANRAEIIAIHVVKPVATSSFGAAVGTPRYEADCFGPELRSNIAQAFFEPLKASGIDHRILSAQGHPAAEIMRIADDEDAGLVVVGNGLNSTMDEIFLGSVAHALTHSARRPLVIVPTHHFDDAVAARGRTQPAAEGKGALVA